VTEAEKISAVQRLMDRGVDFGSAARQVTTDPQALRRVMARQGIDTYTPRNTRRGMSVSEAQGILAKLEPDITRRILELIIKDVCYNDIAKQLGITNQAVRSRLNQLRSKYT
jgi:transposase-like protein